MKYQYETCDRGTNIQPHVYKGERWWCIRSTNQVDRWVRLADAMFLKNLATHYGFIDGNGCVNAHRTSVHQTDPTPVRTDVTLDGLNSEQRGTMGIPQRLHNSGMCWFCALIFVMFFSKQLRAFFRGYMPPDMAEMTQNILNDPEVAERFRRHLYNKFSVGDRPGQDPELDGQNGFTQLCVLAGKLDIPIVRFFAPKMHEMRDPVRDQRGFEVPVRSQPRAGEASLLAVRCFRTKWTPSRRIVHRGRRYKLAAMLIGSEHCGHQIGASTCDLRVCRWALADSDMRQNGVGPMFWSLTQKKTESRPEFKTRWRKMWDDVVPVTIFGRSQLCDLNPVNRPSMDLERFAKKVRHVSTPGVVNTDYIYIHIP